jgi:hypothetical protein
MESILKSVASTGLIYLTHFATTKYYNHFCIANGTWGFVSGLFTTGSPMCHVAVTVLHNTEIAYTSAFSIGLTRFILDAINIKPTESPPATPATPSTPAPVRPYSIPYTR